MSDGLEGFVFVIGGVVGLFIGIAVGADAQQGAAIKAGVAFYSVDSATGQTKFQYRTPAVAP